MAIHKPGGTFCCRCTVDGKSKTLDLKQLQAQGGDPGTTLATAWPAVAQIVSGIRDTLDGHIM